MIINLEQSSRLLEKTLPGIFHIHIDAQELSPALYHFAIEKLGFYDSDFDGHPDGYLHFEPQKHLTLKLKTKQEFTSAWDQLEKEAEKHDWTGYLEGEYISIDEYIPYKAYSDLPVPFHITRRRLDPQKTRGISSNGNSPYLQKRRIRRTTHPETPGCRLIWSIHSQKRWTFRCADHPGLYQRHQKIDPDPEELCTAVRRRLPLHLKGGACHQASLVWRWGRGAA